MDKTWINDKVQLIPRMKGWVSQFYPGTQIGITGIQPGAPTTTSTVPPRRPTCWASSAARASTSPRAGPRHRRRASRSRRFQMYRNVDGARCGFGDRSVRVVVPDPDALSAFAALRSSDGALTVMVINKDAAACAHREPAGSECQRYHCAALAAHQRQPHSGARVDRRWQARCLIDTVPAQSITLYVIR